MSYPGRILGIFWGDPSLEQYSGPLESVQIWSDNEASTGGERIGMVPVQDTIVAEDYFEINGDERFTMVIPSSAAYETLIDHGTVLRTELGDGGIFEWRVRRITWERDANGGRTTRVEGYGMKHDLAMHSPLVSQTMPAATLPDAAEELHFELLELTPAEHLDQIDGSFPPYFAVGNIAADLAVKRVDLAYRWDTPYSAIQEIAVLTDSEWFVDRTSTGGYTVNFTVELNSTAPKPLISYGKSQIAARRTEDSAEMATRVYMRGAGQPGYEATLSDAIWQEYSGLGTTKITVLNMKTLATDQLAGLWLKTSSGGIISITGSWSTSDVSNLPRTAITTSAAVPGTWWTLCDQSDGRPLAYVPYPANEPPIRPMVLKRDDLPGINNWVLDPFFEDWVGSTTLATYTLVGSPAVAQTTGASPYKRYGSNAAHITASAAGEGIVTTAIDMPPPSSRAPHVSCQAMFTVVSGKVRLELIDATPSTAVIYPGSTAQVARSEELEVPVHIAVAPGAVNFFDLGATQFQVQVVADTSGGAEWYMDALQLVRTPVPGLHIVPGQRTNTDEVMAGQDLWNAAMTTLEKSLEPQKDYDVQSLDVYRIAPSLYPGDELVLGGSVWLRDEGIGLDAERRIYSMRRDLKIVGNSVIEFEP